MSDELAARMDKLQDVNWTAVARECVERYVEGRESAFMTPALLQKLREEKGKEHVNGASYGRNLLEKYGYRKVGAAWRKFDRDWDDAHEDAESEGRGLSDDQVLNLFEDAFDDAGLLPGGGASREFLEGIKETIQVAIKSA